MSGPAPQGAGLFFRGEVPFFHMNPIDSQITFCSVADLQRTSNFWGQLIGLPLVLDQGTCRIYRTVGGAHLGFCQREDPGPVGSIILTLVSDEVDCWHERLQEVGVDLEHGPRHNPTYGIYHFFARDPDGYRVEIQKFDDPDYAFSEEEVADILFEIKYYKKIRKTINDRAKSHGFFEPGKNKKVRTRTSSKRLEKIDSNFRKRNKMMEF